MITARIGVLFEDDWTSDSNAYSVFGKFLAYSFHHNQYFALLRFTADDVDGALELVRNHENITHVEIIDRSSRPGRVQEAVTVTLKSTYYHIPPMEMLSYEGYLPMGYPSLEDGRICFDLVLETHYEISEVKELLDLYGDVKMFYLSEELLYQTAPKSEEFQALIEEITPKQLELLVLAVERGYFEQNREVTIQTLADELGVSKTTASEHLHKGWETLLKFSNRYFSSPDT
ncbi:MAG: helix-turn-helix domain-containing protein [Halodesulfurarchaeum sp.]|nr:helix-turn-helix domain-containing protein [Halodesulfurarchaeum sp.]